MPKSKEFSGTNKHPTKSLLYLRWAKQHGVDLDLYPPSYSYILGYDNRRLYFHVHSWGNKIVDMQETSTLFVIWETHDGSEREFAYVTY